MNRNIFKSCMLAALMLWGGSTCLKAQHEEGESTIQPRVGLTLSNLPGEDDAKMKVNFTYGVEYEQYFAENFSVAAGLLFTNQGAKFKDPADDYEMNLYYTAVPITANYYVLPGLAVKAGIQPAFRVKARIEQGNTKIDLDKALAYIFNDNDVKVNKFDLSIPVGLSYELQGVTLDLRYNLGLTKVMSGLDNNVRNSVFTATIGYKF